MIYYHINVGSNLGDSRSLLERAVAEIFSLDEIPDSAEWPRRSSIVESEAWGYESEHRFLNIGVEIRSNLEPEEMLTRLQAIERRISPLSHRNPDGTYRDRLIDIDLIFAHPLTIATLTNNHLANDPLTDDTFADDSAPGITYCCPTLTLPHPRAFEREFVMAPSRELHPRCPHYPRLLGKIVPYDKA